MTIQAPSGQTPSAFTVNVLSDINYAKTFSITGGGNLTNSQSDKINHSFAYAFGSGTGQINEITKVEGTLAAGGVDILDLQAIPKLDGESSYTVELNRLRCLLIENESISSGANIAVQATGSNAFDGLYNGGTGNNIIKPMSTFPYNDPFEGLEVSSSQRYLYIHDVGGSGSEYSIMIGGVK